ncbi:hypothetical protein F5Y10DRAFT_231933 [Nemania abortiva]|nr:hypothetical protein F5Y10DRAFT_231933 [Nemania abortiva]
MIYIHTCPLALGSNPATPFSDLPTYLHAHILSPTHDTDLPQHTSPILLASFPAKPIIIANRPFAKLIMKLTTTFLAALAVLAPLGNAGPAAYGLCQAGCASVVTACYAAAGFTWGATLGASAPASIVACNAAFGTCQAACAAIALAPTP